MPRPATLLGLWTAVLAPLPAQEAAVAPVEPVAPVAPRPWPWEGSELPLRPGVGSGALDNGLRVAWVRCDDPPRTVRAWLHVGAGALMEEPGERGAAHLLEHVVFRGTEHWTARDIERWALENGLSSGPDLNAFTSWVDTTYLVELPTDDVGPLREGLDVLRELATAPLLESWAIQLERAVVDAEERERSTADERAERALEVWGHRGLALAERGILGTSLDRARLVRKDLRRFLERWYRADLLTLVLVGDLPEDPVALARGAFGDLPAPTTPRPPRPAVGTFDPTPTFLVEPVEGWTGATLLLRWVAPAPRPAWSRAGLVRGIEEAIAVSTLDRRLRRLVAERRDLFLAASIDTVRPVPWAPLRGFQLVCATRSGRAWAEALPLVRRELEALLRHGVPDGEMASVRALHRRSIQRTVAAERERDVEEEADWLLRMASDEVHDYDTAALQGAMVEAVGATDAARVLDVLGTATSSEPSIALAGDFDGAPTGERLASLWRSGAEGTVQPRPWAAPPPFVYVSDPERAGEVVERSHDDDLGLTRVRFANGVEVIHAPSDGSRVEVRAMLVGGRRTLTPGRWMHPWLAEEVFLDMGLAAHDPEELARILEPHDVELGIEVVDDAIFLSGNAGREELALQCELACAFLDAPGWSEEIWDEYRAEFAELFSDMARDPAYALGLLFWPELFAPPEGDALRWIPEPAEITGIDLEDLRAWLEPELRGAPLVAVIWGGSTEEVVPVAARTFGALRERRPAPADAERFPVAPCQGLRREYQLPGGLRDAVVYLMLPTSDARVPSRGWCFALLADVLRARLDARVREELGLAYGPEVGVYASPVFTRFGYIDVRVVADAAKAERVLDVCLEVLGELGREGVGHAELERLRGPARVRHEERYWLEVLSNYRWNPAAIETWIEEGEYYRTVPPERLNRYARRYLVPERASIAILRPRR